MLASMATDPWVKPPTISGLLLSYSRFYWCQIQYVYANELVREHPDLQWYDAYTEAGLVVDVLKKVQTPLALGAQPGEVVWPVLICAANRYATLSPTRRADERTAIAAGRPIWSVDVNVTLPELCDPAVIDDPEYQPSPPCVPREVTSGLSLAGAVASGLVGTGLCLFVLLSTPD